ncbi:MAG: circadian clock protein KaiC [Asticcacaulis sp.]
MPDVTHPLSAPKTLPKTPTGIDGLDEITEGGLPAGRPTLVCGSAGCGKTLLSMEFLVHGATRYNEPGIFFAFEETSEELKQNVASLGFDLDALEAEGKLVTDHIHIDPSEIEETGEYDLEGLFIRLGYLIDSIGAKRVVLDTLETLFGGLKNESILRAELRRLFRWLKDKGVTAIITAERGDGTLTRQGLEEYVSDCVILLDHRVNDQNSTRRLRIVKYRGTSHGTNEYPFLIDAEGFSVLPVTSLGLVHKVSEERVSTGVPKLDAMLGGGVYRGTSVLISGTAGSGKSSLSAHFANATCARGEPCLYLSFEESPAQMKRNMRSIGLDLGQWEDKGLLQFIATRPTFYGLEMHLTEIHKIVSRFSPTTVIIDPISNFVSAGSEREAASMLLRLVDFLKMKGITAVFVNLTSGGGTMEATDAGISSLIDTWILLRDIELGGERNRGMYVLKSRGTAHSNQIREFVLGPHGIDLLDVYVGPEGVLTGSMRIAQEAREAAVLRNRRKEAEDRRRALERKRALLQAQIMALQATFETEEAEAEQALAEYDEDERLRDAVRDEMRKSRGEKAVARSGVVTSKATDADDDR